MNNMKFRGKYSLQEFRCIIMDEYPWYRATIKQLNISEQNKRLLETFIFSDYTIAEIARQEGLKPNNLRQRLVAGKRHMIDAIERELNE